MRSVKHLRAWRLATLVTLLGLLMPVVPSGAAAAGSTTSDESGVLLVARKPHRPSGRLPPLHARPTLIQDIRIGDKETHTRVVLDLQRQVTFTQTKRTNPDRVVIDLKHSRLTKAAQAKVASGELPRALEVYPLRSGGVRVALALDSLATYKVLPLSDPPRLVLDLYAQVGANGSAGAAAADGGLTGTPAVLTLPPRPIQDEVRTIVIDPGHGGKDPGAIGRRGTREKDIALRVSIYLRELIERRLDKKVLMTRERDVFVDLEERADFANKNGADLFVSIHVNAHPRRSVKGLEIYYFGKASDSRAMEVAARENGISLDPTQIGTEYFLADLLTTKMVQDSLEFAWTTSERMVYRLKSQYKVVNHGVKTAPFYVLRFTTMPSILAEIGYVSNGTEEKRLRSKAYQRRMAEAIFDGIQAYVASLQVAAR